MNCAGYPKTIPSRDAHPIRFGNDDRHYNKVPQMDGVKLTFDSSALGAVKTKCVRPAFEHTSAWEDILRVLEETGGGALACAGPKQKVMLGNK